MHRFRNIYIYDDFSICRMEREKIIELNKRVKPAVSIVFLNLTSTKQHLKQKFAFHQTIYVLKILFRKADLSHGTVEGTNRNFLWTCKYFFLFVMRY